MNTLNNTHANTTRRRVGGAVLALLLTLAGFGSHASASLISTETLVTLDQYEVFSGEMRMTVGGTVGRRMTLRLYEVSPAGVPQEVKRLLFRIKTKYATGWVSGNLTTRLKIPAGLFKAGSGLRYAFTLQPEGGKRTEVFVNGPWFVGSGQVWWAASDPLHYPYGNSSNRLLVIPPSDLSEIVEE